MHFALDLSIPDRKAMPLIVKEEATGMIRSVLPTAPSVDGHSGLCTTWVDEYQRYKCLRISYVKRFQKDTRET